MSEVLGTQASQAGTSCSFTNSPPKTMETKITAGPMASAASVEGAAAPTASPRALLVKLSSTRMPKNRANLRWFG